MTWSGDLTAAVIDALTAAGADDQPVHTGALVAKLAAVDVHGNWSPLWLQCGAPEQITLQGVRDPEHVGTADTTWGGVQVSGGLAAIDVILTDLDDRYGIEPLQPTMLLIALLLSEWTGASRALRYHGDTTTAALVDLAQDILGTRLEGVVGLRRHEPRTTGVRSGADTEFRVASAGARDDLDLLLAAAVSDRTVSSVLNEAGLTGHLSELLERARPLGAEPADECLERVRRHSLNEPEAFDVAVAVLSEPSPAMDAALRAALATGADLAAMLHLRQNPDRRTPLDFAATTIDVIIMLALGFLIVRHALTAGPLWTLALLPAAGIASSAAPLAASLVAVGLLYRYADTPSVLVAAAGFIVGFVTFQLERFEFLATTGVRLSRKDIRRLVVRRSQSGRLFGNFVDVLLPARMESMRPRRRAVRQRLRIRRGAAA